MEIFGVGLPEIIMIFVVALIVLGPERLPEAARTLGKAVAEVRRAVEPAREAWTELATGLTQTADTVASVGNPWKVHPILEKMTPEEREQYMAGGELPEHVRLEMATLEAAAANGHNGRMSSEAPALQELVYPMPHESMSYEPAPPFVEIEDLHYPEPGQTTGNENQSLKEG